MVCHVMLYESTNSIWLDGILGFGIVKRFAFCSYWFDPFPPHSNPYYSYPTNNHYQVSQDWYYLKLFGKDWIFTLFPYDPT